MIRIIKCSCEHDYQDKVYGKGMRIHNYKKKDEGWRCTVCGTSKDKGASK